MGKGAIYSVFQSAEVQKLWVLGKRQEAKGKGEEKQVYLTSLGNAIAGNLLS
ncbi:programmed cell death toxin YdcE [Microcystis sp. 0824]|nr:programmed cell death toxin YdcE [Microcystis sp. 0824]